MDMTMESALINLINNTELYGVYLDEYQKVELSIYDETVINDILHKCKFMDIGNVYDHPDTLPQPELIDGFDLSANFDLFQRIAVSRKYNSAVFYSVGRFEIECTFMIDIEHLEDFVKKIKPLLGQDSQANIFRDIDFQCKGREYIEISDVTGDEMKPANVIKRKVEKENLVFDDGSAIVEVMNDIKIFFTDDTKVLYKKMEIAYKRGIILYGDPGNGKSAMIRQIIRTIEDVSKIVINPNVRNVTHILSSLLKSLKGRPAIVIIEDIDSLITDRNRSEFLNILDGVDIQSGVYFIGTTNYPNQIDPAFMNRSGRFDRTYKIDNPSESTRRIFFESRKIGELLSGYQVYNDPNKPGTESDVVDMFVKNSADLPMASLKEIMTGTRYVLAGRPNLSIEEAVESTYNVLTGNKKEHAEAHGAYLEMRANVVKRFE